MTPERLEELVAIGDAQGLVDSVADLTESDRRKLSKTAQSISRDLDNADWEMVKSRYVRKPLERWQEYLGNQEPAEPWMQTRTAQLAILAVGPLSKAKKISTHSGRESDGELVLKVMLDRCPDWINDWLLAALDNEFPTLDWETIQGLIQSGACQKPTSDGYYRSMALLCNSWQRLHSDNPLPLSDYLASEPELLDDVWKLFEVDTVAFSYDWKYDPKTKHESWPTAILKLANRDILDRNRLLDATLEGQTTGFKKNILGGFARLHEQLAPRGDELTERQPVYFDLLASHVTQVVGFATKMIKKVEQAKRLDDAAFVQSAHAVFDVSTKGPPKTVISLLKKVARRSPNLRSEICSTLLNALRHLSEEIQSAAIELLMDLVEVENRNIVSEIAERIDDLPASIRPKVSEFIINAGGQVENHDMATDLDDRQEQCLSRVKELNPEWIECAGIDQALNALQESTWAPALNYDVTRVPVLAEREAIEPIRTIDELIDAVAHGIEQVDSPMQVERILDGISRLCDQKPTDFDRRVAPLVDRIEKTKDSEATKGIAKRHIAPVELTKLVGTWLANDPSLGAPSWKRPDQTFGVLGFIDRRIAAIRHRVEQVSPTPLLAMPTHEHGWVAAEVFVSRWHELQRSELDPAEEDVIQALLRMAGDGRQSALQDAMSLTHRWARPLRWALGSEETPTADDTADADVWLAAGRARSPHGVLEELVELGLDVGPDAVQPAHYDWRTKITEHRYAGDEVYRLPELRLTTKPQIENSVFDAMPGRPTVLQHMDDRPGKIFYQKTAWVIEWTALVWPASVDAVYAGGCKQLAIRLDESSSNWDPNYAYFQPLFDADRPWSQLADLLTLLGVAGRDQDARGLAIDALVEAISDGRVHPSSLGATLAGLAEKHWLKLNRLCSNLAEVARVSPLHAWTVAESLNALLIAFPELPRDAHHVLAILQELYAQLGLQSPAEAVERLRSVKGASKTAKLSKALVAFETQESNPAAGAARLLALEARIDRAERWQAAEESSRVSQRCDR